jgi:hypothetical protein
VSDLLERLKQRPALLGPNATEHAQNRDWVNRVHRERAEFDRDLALDALAEALEWFDEETPKDTVQAWRTILAELRKPTLGEGAAHE